MCCFGWFADALLSCHAAHAVDTPALMGDGVPSVDGRKNAATGARILARSSRHRVHFPPVQEKCDLMPPKCKKPPFEHRSNAKHLSRSLYTCKTFRFSTARRKPAPNSLTLNPITQLPLTPPTYASFCLRRKPKLRVFRRHIPKCL